MNKKTCIGLACSGRIIGMGDGKQAQIDLTRDTEGNLTAANLLVDGKVEQQTEFETLDNTTKQQLLASIKAIAEDGQSNSARPEVVINPFEKVAALINQSPTFIQSQIQQLDAQGLITTYTADDFGNIVEVSSPTTGVSSYQYDANRLLIASQSPLNAQTYQRDNIGRVIGIKVSSTDGSTEQHSVEWGKHNKPIKVTYPTGQERFSYNDNAQLLTHTQQVDNQSFTLSYSYDDQGRVQSKTLPDVNVIKYTYNGDDKKKVGVLNSIYLKGIWDKPIITGLNSDSDTSLIQRFNFGNGISNLVQKVQNRLIKITSTDETGRLIPVADYRYNTFNQRIAKTTYNHRTMVQYVRRRRSI